MTLVGPTQESKKGPQIAMADTRMGPAFFLLAIYIYSQNEILIFLQMLKSCAFGAFQ